MKYINGLLLFSAIFVNITIKGSFENKGYNINDYRNIPSQWQFVQADGKKYVTYENRFGTISVAPAQGLKREITHQLHQTPSKDKDAYRERLIACGFIREKKQPKHQTETKCVATNEICQRFENNLNQYRNGYNLL